MASRGASELIPYAVLGFGFYYLGKNGYLGDAVKNAILGIKTADGTKPGTTPGTIPGQTPPPAVTPGGNCPFISGVRYVGHVGSTFIVVWNGAQVYASTSQSDAEQRYNTICARGYV